MLNNITDVERAHLTELYKKKSDYLQSESSNDVIGQVWASPMLNNRHLTYAQ